MNNPFRCIFRSSIRYKLILNILITLLLTAPIVNAIAANDDFSIAEVQSISITQQQKADHIRMTFSAFGHTFNLLMQNNEALMKNYSSRLIDVELYAGEIEGVANSWARITEINGVYSGAIFDGNELYMIDSGAMVAEAVDASIKDVMHDSDTVVFKASEVTSELSCGAHDELSDRSRFSYQSLVSELAQQQNSEAIPSSGVAIAAATATRQVNLDIVADTQYVATSPNGAEAQVLSQMNIVDGIFSEQVGVQFGIREIRVLSNNGPLTSTNSSTLLNQYRSFIGGDNPGLSHLFTGREIDGNVIGVAFVSGICTTSGVGMTQAGGRGALGALTAAHEFGHNFGSPHDNQAGSACVATPGTFLMNPSLNGSDQFSQCSLEQIDNTLSVRSACLVDAEPPEPEPTPVAACNGNTTFASGANGFNFVDDSESPAYTNSSVANGSLNIAVGGVDNADISDMQGAWARACESDSAGPTTIRINGVLSQSPEYESNEFSQIALRVNGNETVLATLTGDGNGGPTQTTGAQEFIVSAALTAGTNTIELVCFNNLKTFANEVTNCGFTGIDVEPESSNASILNVSFNSAFGGFSFEDDNSNPAYSDGERTVNGGVNNSGALSTTLGGVDDTDIANIDASWMRTFTSPNGQFTLSLDGNLVQSPDYEVNESSDIGIRIDGQELVLNSVTGDGNGGGNIGTGFQRYDVQLNLTAGTHSISLFCRNSEKTFNNESTSCTFDNVLIQ